METKKVGEMYGILLHIKEEYKEYANKEQESFDDFAKRRIAKLYDKALDWLLEDKRESNDKIAQ